jgi:hypothetical protein
MADVVLGNKSSARCHSLMIVMLCWAIVSLAVNAFAFRCGKQRWPVKTGTDADIASVDLTQAVPTTVHDLINIPEPNDRPQSSRVAPTETTVWTVDATLTLWKWENSPTSGDWDYHLVLEDADGHSAVGEIPFPQCVDDASPFKARITAARALFDAQVVPQGHQVHIPVRVTGIGFFDLHSAGHNPTGSAANGIELHPILDLVLNPSGGLPPPSQPAPTQPEPAPVTTTAQVIVDGGFETATHSGMSAQGWVTTHAKGPQHNLIIHGGNFPASGSNYAQLGGFNKIDESLSQTISIPSGHPTLTFALNVTTREAEDADSFDFLTVELSSGGNTTPVVTFSNQDFARSNDEDGNYFTVSADLSAFAGQTVPLTFHVKTDNAATTTFRIDDVAIKAN